MKLRNKKTGEIVDCTPTLQRWNGPLLNRCHYNSLTELNEEWEDYEEPKGDIWWLDNEGNICKCSRDAEYSFVKNKKIGNYFETEEEAEKAVEKLKAWKRLKDNGFEFKRYEIIDGRIDFMILPKGEYREKVYEDLDLLFGGEE